MIQSIETTTAVNKKVIQELCCRALETQKNDSRLCCERKFGAADLWEIQKNKRIFIKRRYL